ncbi:hypothetical protein V7266_27010 [Neobacillus drentensis]|uniref:hypothetical protein n=1 Tax=Neobacillus drentensis TaxID=220684 RepID=UPI002FFD8498
MEKDNKLEQDPIEGNDPFLRLMFGNSMHKETYKKGDKPEQKERLSFNRATNRFDDWIFGYKGKTPGTGTQSTLNKGEDNLNNVDFELLIETVDMFFSTAKQYKPLFKEITPSMNRFIKKFKSK